MTLSSLIEMGIILGESLLLPPAYYEWRAFFWRDVYRLFRAVNYAPPAQYAVLRISNDSLLAFLIHPDHIHGTTVDTYPATVA
jgi:hypothetical protein